MRLRATTVSKAPNKRPKYAQLWVRQLTHRPSQAILPVENLQQISTQTTWESTTWDMVPDKMIRMQPR